MANRQSTIALLIGLLVGVLLGAGVLHTAEVTADVLVARLGFYKTSTRMLETGPAVLNPDSRPEERTAGTRTEKGLRFSATAHDIARSCANEDDQKREDCLATAIQRALEIQAGN